MGIDPVDDRRKFKRAENIIIVTFRVKLSLIDSLKTKKKEFAAVGMDISEGGISIDGDKELPAGTMLRLRFEIINTYTSYGELHRRKFDLEGESRYCEYTPKKSYRTGIRFTTATQEDRHFIAQYVKDQAAE